MRYRNENQGREGSYRPGREGTAFPEYEEYGLHGDDRREYRGRESYEQQSRGGQAGRSGMWPQRNVPHEIDSPYRNNSDEDRRGFQNLGSRSEFESANRNRPDYGRYGRANDRDYDEARDFGAREYGAREYGGYDRSDANRGLNDDYSRTDYGDRDRGGRGYGSPYSRRASYNSSYDRGNEYRGQSGYAGNSGNSSWSAPELSYDQGRLALGEYGRSQYQRQTGRGPKGYKRSDERVREDVCDRLGHDWELDASEVEVTVSNGEVTLTGTIGNRDQKFRVEHLADSVSGVVEVHNQLRVKRELPLQGSTQGSTQPTGWSSTTNQNRSS
jgi:osmotically-inducible protein OsmY